MQVVNDDFGRYKKQMSSKNGEIFGRREEKLGLQRTSNSKKVTDGNSLITSLIRMKSPDKKCKSKSVSIL